MIPCRSSSAVAVAADRERNLLPRWAILTQRPHTHTYTTPPKKDSSLQGWFSFPLRSRKIPRPPRIQTPWRTAWHHRRIPVEHGGNMPTGPWAGTGGLRFIFLTWIAERPRLTLLLSVERSGRGLQRLARRALRAPEAPTGASAATEQRRDRGSRDTKRSTREKFLKKAGGHRQS